MDTDKLFRDEFFKVLDTNEKIEKLHKLTTILNEAREIINEINDAGTVIYDIDISTNKNDQNAFRIQTSFNVRDIAEKYGTKITRSQSVSTKKVMAYTNLNGGIIDDRYRGVKTDEKRYV